MDAAKALLSSEDMLTKLTEKSPCGLGGAKGIPKLFHDAFHSSSPQAAGALASELSGHLNTFCVHFSCSQT